MRIKILIVSVCLLTLAALLALSPRLMQASAAATTVRIYVQVTDSCKQVLGGASLSLVDSNDNVVATGTTSGAAKQDGSVPGATSGCPTQKGTCKSGVLGCLFWDVAVPASGTAVYTIQENTTSASLNGTTFLENPTGPGGSPVHGFVACTGGSDCKSEVATVNISSSGSVSGSTKNIAPNGSTQTYGPFTMTQTTPLLFHNFEVGSQPGTSGSIQCDGDKDRDDWLTGSPSSKCDSEHD